MGSLLAGAIGKMADQKVSELAGLAAASVDVDNDLLNIVDTSAGVDGSKKITVQALADVVIQTADSFIQSGIASANQASRTMAAKAGDILSLKDFKNTGGNNVVGDDSQDDTTGIQAAFDYMEANACTVFIPPGTYKITSGVTLSPSSAAKSNLFGLGAALGVKFKYYGTGGVAITIKDNGRYRLDNFSVEDAGTGVTGISLLSVGTGSSHGPALGENIYVTGFDEGVRIGNSSDNAASEINLGNVELNSCTDGIVMEGQNSLNLTIRGFNASSCTRALKLVGEGDDQRNTNCVTINGGSLSGNTTDFQMDRPGNLTVIGVRSEGSVAGHKFLSTGAASVGTTQVSPAMVHLISCFDQNSSGADQLLHWPGTYIVTGGKYENGFSCGGQTGAQANKSSLLIEGAVIQDNTPVARVAGITDIWRVRIRNSLGNNVNVADVNDDEEWTWNGSGTKTTLMAYDWINLDDALQIPRIQFPAAQSASSDANTLDDYEEGTFTPVVQGASTAGAQTYSVQSGRYTKIGRLVFYEVMIRMTAKDGTTAGNISIGGLPFTSNNSTPRGNVAIGMYANIDLNTAGGLYSLIGEIVGNTTKIDLYSVGDNVAAAAIGDAAIAATTEISVGGHYTV